MTPETQEVVTKDDEVLSVQMNAPFASIIIPVCGQLAYTARCFERLERFTEDVEYVFVDDGSMDGTPGYLRQLAEMRSNVKVVTLPDRRGYPVAINCGLLAVNPHVKYVVFCNNDVLVTKGWLKGLTGALDGAETQTNMKGFAIAGPMTNWAWPSQMVDTSGQPQYSLDNIPSVSHVQRNTNTLDTFAETWSQQHGGQRISVGACSGFMMVVKKEVVDVLGGLEERLSPGGFDDNDFCLRARYAGYRSLIATDVYVHHYGSRTLNALSPGVNLGLSNRWLFTDIWRHKTLDETHKLAIGYRVKDPDQSIFEQSLRKSLEVADHVVVFDDNSDLSFRRWLKKFALDEPKLKVVESKFATFDERRDRQSLWNVCAEIEGVTWVLVLDGDEILEEQFDRHYAEKLMRNPDPNVQGYNVHIYNMWNNPEYWREDGRWGNHVLTAMARVVPNMTYGKMAGNKLGMHCGRLPHVPATSCFQTSVRIKHFGYLTDDDRVKKLRWYLKHDTDFRPDILKAPSYFYITDELELRLRKWEVNQKISQVTLVGNEKDWFPELMTITYGVVHQHVIVDTGCKDGTLDCLQYYPFDVKVVREPWQDDYAYMRNAAKNACDGDWILQLDADERPQPNFANMLIRLCEMPIPCWQFEIHNYHVDGNFTLSNTVRLFKNIPQLFYTGKVHETLDDAMQMMGARALTCPFKIAHFGYQKGHYEVQQKLNYYERLNKEEIEEHPNDGRAYFNLGLHYLNDGRVDEGVKMLETCLERSPNNPNALKELMAHHLRMALAHGVTLQQLLPPTHHLSGYLGDVIQRLNPIVPPMTIVGKAAMSEEQWQQEVERYKSLESISS